MSKRNGISGIIVHQVFEFTVILYLQCSNKMKKRRVGLLSTLDDLKVKTDTLRQVLAMTSENKLGQQTIAAIKTALAAGKMPVNFMKECVGSLTGADTETQAKLLSRVAEMCNMAETSVPETTTKSPMLESVNGSIKYAYSLLQRQSSESGSVDFDTTSNSSGCMSSQECISSQDFISSQETVTSTDTDLITSGGVHERDRGVSPDQGLSDYDTDSCSDMEECSPFEKPLVIDLQ